MAKQNKFSYQYHQLWWILTAARTMWVSTLNIFHLHTKQNLNQALLHVQQAVNGCCGLSSGSFSNTRIFLHKYGPLSWSTLVCKHTVVATVTCPRMLAIPHILHDSKISIIGIEPWRIYLVILILCHWIILTFWEWHGRENHYSEIRTFWNLKGTQKIVGIGIAIHSLRVGLSYYRYTL